jgi:hypothetical protein
MNTGQELRISLPRVTPRPINLAPRTAETVMKTWNASTLRRIAGDVLGKIAGDEEIADSRLSDLTLSVVRQWQTYDGNALVYFPDRSFLLHLTGSPDGFKVVSDRQPDWLEPAFRSWKVPLEALPEVIDQLNRGQSAEVVNADHLSLRLWANPREWRHGVERVDGIPAPAPPPPRDYRKLAAAHLQQVLGTIRDAEELAHLVEAVARQWRLYDGQACPFLGGELQLVLAITERPDGGSHVVSVPLPVQMTRLLVELGIHPEVVPEVLRRLNLCEQVEYRNRDGVPSILWYDAPARRLGSWPKNPPVPVVAPAFPLGTIEIEPGAARVLAEAGQDVSLFLNGHAARDWGDAGDRRRFENDFCLEKGGVLRSAFSTCRGAKLIVTTLADRTRTVVSYADPRLIEDMLRAARRRP